VPTPFIAASTTPVLARDNRIEGVAAIFENSFRRPRSSAFIDADGNMADRNHGRMVLAGCLLLAFCP